MKTPLKIAALFVPVFVLLVIYPFEITIAQQSIISPTATSDPLVEPPLPANPTEYELGRNLYWHWCMTCHGDVGQGLTDEFRSIWVEDHQNCWARGCHAGHGPEDLGFPIPTVVPALVNDAHLGRFACLQELSDFLEATHPPQSPGVLNDEEYHAIALFVFTMNDRALIEILITDTPAGTSVPTVSTLTATPVIPQEPKGEPFPASVIVVFAILAGGLLAFVGLTRRRK